jgi:hypothetical protein
MLFLHKSNLGSLRLYQAGRQQGQAVFLAFPFADNHLGLFKVDILKTLAQALHQAWAANIEQTGHQLVQPLHPVQHLVHFIFRGNRWRDSARLERRE